MHFAKYIVLCNVPFTLLYLGWMGWWMLQRRGACNCIVCKVVLFCCMVCTVCYTTSWLVDVTEERSKDWTVVQFTAMYMVHGTMVARHIGCLVHGTMYNGCLVRGTMVHCTWLLGRLM